MFSISKKMKVFIVIILIYIKDLFTKNFKCCDINYIFIYLYIKIIIIATSISFCEIKRVFIH